MSHAVTRDSSFGEGTGVLVEDEVDTQDMSGVSMPDPEESPQNPPAEEAMERQELKAILEALLFVSQEPFTLDRLTAVLGEVSKVDLKQAIEELGQDLEVQGRGLQLVKVAGGYRFVTRSEYAPWVKRLEKVKPAPKLSRSALEALAIIAYKQPIVRSEIEGIRGVETSGVLRTLLERNLIRMVGRKDIPGRPIMYGTTKFFLEHFGLPDLSELPPLREFKELGEPQQTDLPIGDEPLIIGENGSEPQAPTPELEGSVRATDMSAGSDEHSRMKQNHLEEELEEEEFEDDEDDDDEEEDDEDDEEEEDE